MTLPVPDHDVPNWSINIPDRVSPWSATWWSTVVVTNIPGDSVGWLLAQGWTIASVSYDTSTIPATPRYSMTKQKFSTSTVLQHLLDDFTNRDNTAKWANEVRYNSVVEHWAGLVDNTEDYLDTQAQQQAEHVALYLTNLDTYMNDINTDIDATETNYTSHVTTATNFLDGLGTTDEARIREHFAASLATQTQQLVDNGLYSSGRITDITARNTRDLNEELAKHNDRINREKWENQHKLYEQQVQMSKELIVNKMNVSMARLTGLDRKEEQDMQLMKYFLDTRNQLLVGLYGFVERRDDLPPSWENLSQIVAALGDSGGGWISP